MNAPRIIPAGPMGLDAILPLIREVGQLRERGRQREAEAEVGDCGGVAEYHAAAELEERIRQPITVAGRTLAPCGNESAWHWWCETLMLMARADAWSCVVTSTGDDTAIQVQTQGGGPTIAAALSDARERYQAAIGDTLLRMGGLLREVGK